METNKPNREGGREGEGRGGEEREGEGRGGQHDKSHQHEATHPRCQLNVYVQANKHDMAR